MFISVEPGEAEYVGGELTRICSHFGSAATGSDWVSVQVWSARARFRTATTHSRSFQVRTGESVNVIGDKELGLTGVFKFVSIWFQVSGGGLTCGGAVEEMAFVCGLAG